MGLGKMEMCPDKIRTVANLSLVCSKCMLVVNTCRLYTS